MEVIFCILVTIYIFSVLGSRKEFQKDFEKGVNRRYSGFKYLFFALCPLINTIVYFLISDYSSWGHKLSEWFFKKRSK